MDRSDDIGDVWRRSEIESPCVNVCVLHPTAKLCLGCYRSGNEIARWSGMQPEERRAIMATLSEREGDVAKAGPAQRPGRRTNRRFANRIKD